eukprot:270724-Prorocentrum_minimum.AAC.2
MARLCGGNHISRTLLTARRVENPDLRRNWIEEALVRRRDSPPLVPCAPPLDDRIGSQLRGSGGAAGGVHRGGHVRAARAPRARHAGGLRDGGGQGDEEGLPTEHVPQEALEVDTL